MLQTLLFQLLPWYGLSKFNNKDDRTKMINLYSFLLIIFMKIKKFENVTDLGEQKEFGI